ARLSTASTAAVASVAAGAGLTLEGVVDGAWALLLARYGAGDDVVFGSAAGTLTGLVPVRARIAAEGPLLPWMRALAAHREAARPFAHTPLASIQQWCGLPRGTALFDSVVLTLAGAELHDAGRELGAGEFRLLEQTGYPLTLRAHLGAQLSLGISYDRARFADVDAERMLHDLLLAVQGIAATPEPRMGDAFFLVDREQKQLRAQSQAEPLHASVHQVIAEHAARAPGAVALVCEGEVLTYGELNRRANRLAHHLIGCGVGPDSLVGLLVERSAEMVVGVLGILKAGAAYVPLDPAYPPSRIQLTLDDARPPVVVTQTRLAASVCGVPVVALDEVLGSTNDHDPAVPSAPESLAYVIYTSGSTGRPKGVMVTHGNLRHYLPAIAAATGVAADDVYLHTASIAFSSSVRQLFVPLSLGGTVVIASRREVGDPRLLLEAVKERGVTVMDLVPSYWRNCVEVLEAADDRAALLDNALRLVLSASEPLPAELPRRWTALGHPAALINMFGQTETSGIATVYPVRDAAELRRPVVPIGRPIAGTQIYLLDANGRAVPAGVPGELCIAGEGVARGYLNRPELNAEKFVPNPFGEHGRLYRTGDLARFGADGTLEFLGRGDNQVKIRGFRVETEEVEAALRRSPAVREALVTARRDDAGDQRLVAYVVGDASAAELRALLRSTLPDYMVPSAWVALPALPRTPNGKVDRSALPAPELLREGLGGGYMAPRTPVEEILAGVWAEVLGVDRVGVEDNFFELGGHSLLAVRAATRIRAALRTEVPMRRLFETPTIAGLVDALRPAEPLPPIARVAGPVPLSSSQQRLWVIHQMDPGSAAYNLGAALRLTGALDVAALERTLTEIVRRHESLRTVFPTVDGAAAQHVLAPARVTLAPEPAADVAARLAEEVERPFDLESGPLFRARLLRVGAEDHVLVMAMHHIISDGWSRGVLYGEISALYPAFAAGGESPLPELPIQYADFAEWQREWLQGDALAPQLAYWKERLGGSLPKLDLPTDRPRPPVQTSHGATLGFALPAELAAAVRTLCAREAVTPFMALLAAFQTLLSRYSGQEEILVGSPVAGRSRTEAEGLIGFFVNTVVLRTDLSGNPTFRELLGRVRDGALGAYENQDLPFEQVVETVQAERDLSRSPLFQVMFILQNTPAHAVKLGGVEVETLDAYPRAAKFDLTLSVTAGEGGLACNLEYNTDLFDAGTIGRMAEHFRVLLEGAVADPAQPIASLPLLTAGEREQLLTTWNETETEYPADRCVHQLFEEQAARTPNATAIVFR
ncbi:MAG: amino acid adenylation domain-containing protein, partial [Gemmatimonadetes bacterium]|nr:amino acid adenylation domain-containing protein [Gemmatimonadota bacterium]